MQNTNFRPFPRRYARAGFFIGFAAAGFFDGILLHQILQWHSLLSSFEGQAFQDLRFRMLTDGIFHAAMYAVGLAGLWLLWRARGEFASTGSGKHFLSVLLIGFGSWHLIDAIINHWLLGLHHIKEGSPNWLTFDLAFFALGILCVGLGASLGRSGGTRGRRMSRSVASGVAIIVAAAGVIAASPWSRSSSVTVVFRQGISPAVVLAAVESANGRLLWSNPEGDVWTVAVENKFTGWDFYKHGALYVSGSFFGMGCFSAAPAPAA